MHTEKHNTDKKKQQTLVMVETEEGMMGLKREGEGAEEQSSEVRIRRREIVEEDQKYQRWF